MNSGLCRQNKQQNKQQEDIDPQLNNLRSEIRMLRVQKNDYKSKYERLCRSGNSTRSDFQSQFSKLQTQNRQIKEENERLQSNVVILKEELVTNEEKLRKAIQNTQKVSGMMEREIYRLRRLQSNTETQLQDIKRTICHSQPNTLYDNSIVESFVITKVDAERQK